MRRNAAGLRDLLKKFESQSDVRFVLVYQREPHARQQAFQDVKQPKNRAERVALAKKTLAELNLDIEVWIDDEGDQSRALFGDVPHSAIVIDKLSTVKAKLPWCDPAALARVLPEVAAEEFVPAAPQAPEWTKFLSRVSSKADMPQHHRFTMLAHLAVNHSHSNEHGKWLAELASNGPEHQRAWARARMAHTRLIDEDEKTAIAAAITEGKLLLYSFTGFNCASCRIMENQFEDRDVTALMRKHLVELRLHTDTQSTLTKERFDANVALQKKIAKTVAVPFYVVVDPANGQELARFHLRGDIRQWSEKWCEFVEQTAKQAGRK